MNDRMKELLAKTEQWIDDHKEEFITELQGMTRIHSVSRADLAQPGAPFGPECRKMLDYAMDRGRYYGFGTMDHEGYAASIYMGDPDDALGVFSHLDVVPVGSGWIYPPFEALYLPEHDCVVGRGSDDNKCAAVAVLFAMRMLREFGWPLRHGIRLYCGVSEETGMQDMIALKEKGHQFPKLNLVPDSGFPVNYGQKGSVNADISIRCEGNLFAFAAGTASNVVPAAARCIVTVPVDTVQEALGKLDSELTKEVDTTACPEGTMISAAGVSAHTANPEKGLNAIWRLCRVLTASGLLEGSCAEAIAQLAELSSDYTGKHEGVAYSDEMSGALTLVYTTANLKDGVLSVTTNSRTPITCDVEELSENLKKAWTARGFDIVSISCSKPYYVPVDDPHVVSLQEQFHEITGLDYKPFVMSGGNYARVIPNAYSYGPGMDTKKKLSDFMPEGHGNCHGPDEAVIMEKAHNCAKLYVMAIALMDEMMD